MKRLPNYFLITSFVSIALCTYMTLFTICLWFTFILNDMSKENHPMMERELRPLSRLPSPPHSKPGYALSLLSSPNLEPWMISSGDLSSRCSAALYELIAANRATNFAGNLLNQNTSHQTVIETTVQTLPNTQMWIDSMMHVTRPWHWN